MELDISMLSSLGKKNNLSSSFGMIFSGIDEQVAATIIEWIISANFAPLDERPEMLNLMVMSPGGDLHAAFAIIDVMNSSHIPIRTIGLGEIASAGLMIFMAGTKGERILTPNTSIMSHVWSGGSTGKAHELFSVQKEFSLTNKRMLAHYKKCTGLPEKTIKDKLLTSEDVYLSGEEAVKLKIADKVALLK